MLSPAIVFFSAALASASASASAPTLSNPFHDDGQANDRTPAADGDPANTLCRSRGKFLPAPVFALETCYLCYVYMPHTLFAGEGGADKWRGADGGVVLGHAVPALTDGQNMVGIWIANPRSIEGLFCLSPRGIIRSIPPILQSIISAERATGDSWSPAERSDGNNSREGEIGEFFFATATLFPYSPAKNVSQQKCAAAAAAGGLATLEVVAPITCSRKETY